MSELKAKRLLLQGGRSCPFNCQYCFADLSCFKEAEFGTIGSALGNRTNADILYPSCDTEIDLSADKISEILENALAARASAVSISTKSRFSTKMHHGIMELKERLCDINIILKFSISVSTKSQLSTIEAGASCYEERLELALALRNLAVFSSINLKPILPFIETTEYCQIVDDFIPLCDKFTLGGLYLGPETNFGQAILSQYPGLIADQAVDWIPGGPTWKICYDKDKILSIENHIRRNGGLAFHSDKDLVVELLNGTQEVRNG